MPAMFNFTSGLKTVETGTLVPPMTTTRFTRCAFRDCCKRILPVRRGISGRAMELIGDHESFLTLSNRSALSILNASSNFAQASYLVSGQPWLIVRMEQKAFGGILCLLRSDWSLHWLLHL